MLQDTFVPVIMGLLATVVLSFLTFFMTSLLLPGPFVFGSRQNKARHLK